MTIQIKDLPENENHTPAVRLKAARENKGITRKRLSSLTGIPEKSIEKYEYGGMEPNITRLVSLCDALGTTPSDIINTGASIHQKTGNSEQRNTIEEEQVKRSEYILASLAHLETLDGLRKKGFDNYPRKVDAHFNALKETLCFLEYDELNELAEARGIQLADVENALSDAIVDENEDAVLESSSCLELVDRIIDTAVFGIDLYSIELEVLSSIAEEHDIVPDRFFWMNWIGHAEIVPKIRSYFLDKVIKNEIELDFFELE